MVVVRVLLYSVCGRRQSVVARLRVVTNVTPHFEKRIAYSDLIPKTAIGGQFGWGGTPSKGYEKCDFWISSRMLDLISTEPKGQLKPVRNRLESARAKVGLIGIALIPIPNAKAWSSEPQCPP